MKLMPKSLCFWKRCCTDTSFCWHSVVQYRKYCTFEEIGVWKEERLGFSADDVEAFLNGWHCCTRWKVRNRSRRNPIFENGSAGDIVMATLMFWQLSSNWIVLTVVPHCFASVKGLAMLKWRGSFFHPISPKRRLRNPIDAFSCCWAFLWSHSCSNVQMIKVQSRDRACYIAEVYELQLVIFSIHILNTRCIISGKRSLKARASPQQGMALKQGSRRL